MAGTGKILLYWNFKEQKWQDNENFAINGGTTNGKQWFLIPAIFQYAGDNTFTLLRDYKLEYTTVKVTGYVSHSGARFLQDGKTDVFYKPSKITPRKYPLQTYDQMPYIDSHNLSDTYLERHYFLPMTNYTMAMA